MHTEQPELDTVVADDDSHGEASGAALVSEARASAALLATAVAMTSPEKAEATPEDIEQGEEVVLDEPGVDPRALSTGADDEHLLVVGEHDVTDETEVACPGDIVMDGILDQQPDPAEGQPSPTTGTAP